ncbi:VCBS domain-containing protein, partial [Zwartia vadi]|uniref:VCBS domain-containing protein n=1 Tax=Zwartia vadi TaxID=3058168 RepID=UPI0025B33A39
MADENKPTPQQSQDAVQLDSLTSLQQTTEGDQTADAPVTDVRADSNVASPQVGSQDGPSFYLPNTDLTNAPPAQSGDSPVSDSDSDSADTPQINDGNEVDDTGLDLFSVTVADTPESQATPSQSSEGTSAANSISSSSGSGSGAPGPTNGARIGTAQTQEEVAAEAGGNEQQVQPLVLAPETQPVELTAVPQTNEAVVADPIAPAIPVTPVTPVAPESVSTLSSAAVALTESDAVLSVSGALVVTDADVNAATVVAQSNTEGAYGFFSIGSNGAWTYTAKGALNQLSDGQVLTETFAVATTDGGGSTVTITVTGSNDGPVATDDSTGTGENAVLNSRVPVATDVDGTVESYTLVEDVTAGKLTFNADGTYSFDPESAFDDLADGDTRAVTFTYTATDDFGAVSGTQTVTITVTGSNDGPVATDDSTGTGENAVLNSRVPVATDVDGTV